MRTFNISLNQQISNNTMGKKKPFKTKKKNKSSAEEQQKKSNDFSWRRLELSPDSKVLESNHYDDEKGDFTELYDDSAQEQKFGMFGGFIEVMDGNAYIANRRNNHEMKKEVIHFDEKDTLKEKTKKKKKKKSSSNLSVEKKVVENFGVDFEDPSDQDIIKTSANWSSAGANMLHHDLIKILSSRKYFSPTPIQAKTLASSLFGCDIVGAAPTGSGKTIAYLLPILNMILSDTIKASKNELLALILTPTRELALQVTEEAKVLSPSTKVCTIVGGLAHAKQIRLLSLSPHIVVATPGRLWDIMSSESHSLFNNLSRSLRFLVIDEADRMLVHGKFAELERILNRVNEQSMEMYRGNEQMSLLDNKGVNVDSHEEDIEKLLGLGPVESKIEMMPPNDLITQVTGQCSTNISQNDSDPHLKVTSRQTFIYSATLTLDANLNKRNTKAVNKNKRKIADINGPLSNILEKAKVQNKVKFIDLSTNNKSTKNSTSLKSAKLPPGLSLYEVKCTQKHKDSYLYGILACTPIGSSGPSLVFCNSIACVKRLHALLSKLKISVRMLHAEMAQKSRLQVIESLSSVKTRSVVVCTDVAARGLDLESIASVIHYDIPRSVDTFVHRSGRTARGVGEKAVGNSVSLVSSAEERKHKDCCLAVGLKFFDDATIDGQLLNAAQERVALASKIVAHEELESKTSSDNAWYKKAAEEAGIELDDSLLEDAMDGKSRKQRKQHLEGGFHAVSKLRALLLQPMRTQNFGKFLSGAGVKKAIRLEHEVTPHIYKGAEGDHSRKPNKRKR